MSRSWSSVIPSPSVSPVGAREDNCGIEKEKEKAEEALPVAVEDWLIGVELAKEGKENEKKKEDWEGWVDETWEVGIELCAADLSDEPVDEEFPTLEDWPPCLALDWETLGSDCPKLAERELDWGIEKEKENAEEVLEPALADCPLAWELDAEKEKEKGKEEDWEPWEDWTDEAWAERAEELFVEEPAAGPDPPATERKEAELCADWFDANAEFCVEEPPPVPSLLFELKEKLNEKAELWADWFDAVEEGTETTEDGMEKDEEAWEDGMEKERDDPWEEEFPDAEPPEETGAVEEGVENEATEGADEELLACDVFTVLEAPALGAADLREKEKEVTDEGLETETWEIWEDTALGAEPVDGKDKEREELLEAEFEKDACEEGKEKESEDAWEVEAERVEESWEEGKEKESEESWEDAFEREEGLLRSEFWSEEKEKDKDESWEDGKEKEREEAREEREEMLRVEEAWEEGMEAVEEAWEEGMETEETREEAMDDKELVLLAELPPPPPEELPDEPPDELPEESSPHGIS